MQYSHKPQNIKLLFTERTLMATLSDHTRLITAKVCTQEFTGKTRVKATLCKNKKGNRFSTTTGSATDKYEVCERGGVHTEATEPFNKWSKFIPVIGLGGPELWFYYPYFMPSFYPPINQCL